MADLERVRAAVAAAAWDEGRECEHCCGTGRGPGGRRFIHSMSGMIGCDWAVEDVLELIGRAAAAEWTDDPFEHRLEVHAADGWVVRFQVDPPEDGS